MKKYAVGDTVYILESRRDIRMGQVIHISGDLYTIRFDYSSAIRVHESRLFASAEDAAKQIRSICGSVIRTTKERDTGGSGFHGNQS